MKIRFLLAAALAATAAAAQPLPPDKPLVSRGDTVVTAQDFEAQMLRIPEAMRLESRSTLDRVATMTDTLFVNRALADEAKAAGFLDDPLVKLRGQQVLEAYQARAWLDNIERTYKFPNLEAKAREIYLSERARYTVPETFAVDHILVNLWGRTREMGLARINEARAKIQGGADFYAVAKEYTDDSGFKQNGGKLGVMAAADLDAAIGQVVARLKIGEVSEPILTRSGYHIVRVTARTPGRVLPFEDVKESIIEEERGRIVKRVADEKIQALRREPTRIDAEALKALVREVPRDQIQKGHQPTAAPAKK
jgi:peptidyl-prolyl cis-trans isomerase C